MCFSFLPVYPERCTTEVIEDQDEFASMRRLIQQAHERDLAKWVESK